MKWEREIMQEAKKPEPSFLPILRELCPLENISKGGTIYYNAVGFHPDCAAYLERGVCALTGVTKNGEDRSYMYFQQKHIVAFSQLIEDEFQMKQIFTDYRIQAKTDCSLYRIPKTLFRQLQEENVDFSRHVAQVAFHNYMVMLSRFHAITEDSVQQRLCKALLDFEETDEHGVTRLPSYFTNRELAHFLGTHSVTISRIMTQLKKDNCVSKQGHHLVILDKEKLEAYVDNQIELSY